VSEAKGTTNQGPHLLPRQIAKLCYAAGWIDADRLLIAISVCLAESNGYSAARHVNDDGSIDRGLWQINDRAHPTVSDAEADDPVKATLYAREVYESHSNTFAAWSAFTNGAYKGPRAMGYAFDAVANFLRVKHGYPLPLP
jgi:hypothetical protein